MTKHKYTKRTRKKYSNDNRLTVQFSQKEYQKILNEAHTTNCSKSDVVRLRMSNKNSGLNQRDIDNIKRYDNKIIDVFNKHYLNIYRIGSNLNQYLRNQNIAMKHGYFKPVNATNLTKLCNEVATLKNLFKKYIR